jgi:hypothetical protein
MGYPHFSWSYWVVNLGPMQALYHLSHSTSLSDYSSDKVLFLPRAVIVLSKHPL